MKVVTVQEMRSIEASSVEHGVSLDQLQSNAAAAVAGRLRFEDDPHLFLVGPGNNGRDALIAAAIHAESGGDSIAYLAPKVLSDDVRKRLLQAGGEILTLDQDGNMEALSARLERCGAVVDGLLGIGVRGPAREPIASLISQVNEISGRRGIPVLAVDLPSGIDADSGDVPGPSIRATSTLSLGCVKDGLLLQPAAEYVGHLDLLEIGLPLESYSGIARSTIDAAEVARILPKRPLLGHKGTFGRVLVVAGSANFVGAPYLVGAAAARTGCGIVTLAVPEWQRLPLVTLLPEATYLPLRENQDDESVGANASAIASVAAQCQALVIGPGLGQGNLQTELVMTLLESLADREESPVVVDADGLNALSAVPDWWERTGKNLVLTPHPGEMGRLVGLSTGEVNGSRLRLAREASSKWGQVVVLKGAYTVVASPDGEVWVNPSALPALATGGSGDVLSGIIAGLLSQGASPAEAARSAVYVHSRAAEGVLAREGTDRLLASDLLPEIPRAISTLQSAR